MEVRMALDALTSSQSVSHSALSEQVVDRLRRLIITGELSAGTHLVETRISEALMVSRGPVRDALRQLESEGLVGARRGRTYVIGLTQDDIDELYHLRQLIEVEALRLMIENPERDTHLAHAALKKMFAAVEQRDTAAYAHYDLEFHTALYQAANLRRLTDVWLNYRPTFSAILEITNAEDPDLNPSYSDHVELLEAAESGDFEHARKILTMHLAGSHARMRSAHQRRTETMAGGPRTET